MAEEEYRVVPRSGKRITKAYKKGSHNGVDIGWSSNEKNNIIHPNCAGVVVEVKTGMGKDLSAKGAATWGNYVLVRHANGYYTRYAHLKSVSVKVGEEVTALSEVGIMGESGRAYGRHLHFEVAKGYSSTTRIDPTPYLTAPVAPQEPEPAPAPEPTPETKHFVRINARSGLWARGGVGFGYKKVVAIPYGSLCPLLGKSVGASSGYTWDKIEYKGKVLYVPNKWCQYIDK